MIIRTILLFLLFKAATGSYVNLATDYRLYTLFLCRFIKIYSAIHNAVIGNCYCGLSARRYSINKFIYTAAAVKQTVFGMQMQMCKAHAVQPPYLEIISSYISIIFFSR